MIIPTLNTDRLLLRPHTLADAPDLVRLAGAQEVAATTLRIPHPYSIADGEKFIHAVQSVEGTDAAFAVVLREGLSLVGGVGLHLQLEHGRAELGYWIAVPYWGQGFATEAALAVARYGFEELGLHRIYASHFAGNIASGSVLKKIGMKYEGRQRGPILKWGQYLDLELYGLLRSEWV